MWSVLKPTSKQIFGIDDKYSTRVLQCHEATVSMKLGGTLI